MPNFLIFCYVGELACVCLHYIHTVLSEKSRAVRPSGSWSYTWLLAVVWALECGTLPKNKLAPLTPKPTLQHPRQTDRQCRPLCRPGWSGN